MLFNSIEFALFLPVVFVLYWAFTPNKSATVQNGLLLVSSYFFYACWDFRFLGLLLFSTTLDFVTALQIQRTQAARARKGWLMLSIIINLGFLGLFKYYNFFVESFIPVVESLGLSPSALTLKVILPVGISFYTFHGLSYIIDVYKKRIPAERNFIDYGLFVSYFPLLVAGPIERATHLLPQIKQKRHFRYSEGIHGVQQILWGLFKKVVVADNCATIVNQVFDKHNSMSGASLIVGAVLFSFQIYGDFSGYSDIAIGVSKLFGIQLIRNFSYPYFSRDIAEFWRRWHISLTTWFRDYIYIPLGGSRVSQSKIIRNTFIIFLVSGIWHGANYTFVVWGLYHALLFLPLVLASKNRANMQVAGAGKQLPTLNEFIQIVFTFALVTLGWIIFRSANITEAGEYLSNIVCGKQSFCDLTFLLSSGSAISLYTTATAFSSIVAMMFCEWHYRESSYGFALDTPNPVYRVLMWVFLSIVIYLGLGSPASFIYFQF